MWYFFILFGLSVFLLFLVFKPFLEIMVVASVLAVLLYPFYKKILSFFRGNKTPSALMAVLIAVFFIVTPIYFLGIQILEEARSLYTNVQVNGGPFIQAITRAIETPFRKISPDFTINIQDYLTRFADFLLQNLGPIASGTAFVAFEVLITIITLFFFLKNGDEFLESISKFSPLDDKYDTEILTSIQRTINSVLRGSLLIAVIQGFLVGTGFYLFQVPNASLWGLVAAFCALIPGVGTAFVTIPAILYLFLTSNSTLAMGLLIWSALLVGSIDNFLAPYLYNKGIKIHPLFVFFSVLGGIIYFGPMGFLFGPIILSAFLSIFRVYRRFILKEEDS